MAQEYRSDILERILKKLHAASDGVKATVIVNSDGLLVAAYPPGDDENYYENPTSSPQVAAMSASLVALADKTLRRLAQGDLERILMEGQDGVMVVYPAGKASVAVLVEKGARLSYALYATKKAAAEIVEVIGG
ncbi:MAG: roadblock/LC7 domain-containing protein [Pleurocapsa minor GSE-CHR-MK-17-07R]|jgi:predicted regulator of Ras-like GTPase activity (Roadblock/LC7/MglB family)|nr:roadblock/LC7 domain-containing protein [Pleurocapsa minor GSE-CHR-MK 17-07R]